MRKITFRSKYLLRFFLMILLSVPVVSFGQETYNFDNCGASGRFGPTQAQVNSAYTGTNLDGAVTVNIQGIQEWTVPADGIYIIEALGAQGGSGGGLGASVTGTFNLTAGQELLIVAGQQGEAVQSSSNAGSGGGGGTFVVLADSNTPLLVAAGGGGFTSTFLGNDALNPAISNGQGGTTGASTSGAPGATGGNGGLPGQIDCCLSGNIGGGGGGGFFTNGGDGSSGPSGGVAFLNAALGGQGISTSGGFPGTGTGHGGFGGGAGAVWDNAVRSGGGGGYNGGEGATYFTYIHGAGGGSLNTGTDQINTTGANSGNGQVIITQACPTTAPVITCPDDIVVNSEPGSCSAVVTFTTPTDDCATITQTAGLPSGADFPVGSTVVTFEITNAYGTDTCSFTVTVEDNQAPVALCVAPFTLALDANGEASITPAMIDNGSTDNCTNTTLTFGFVVNGFNGDFAPANWSFNTNGGTGSYAFDPSNENVTITGSNGDNGTNINTELCNTLNFNGVIQFDWNYTTGDTDGPSYDPFGYSLNGTFVSLTNPSGPVNQTGTASIPVTAGDQFCFVSNTTDDCCGSATTVSGMFVFDGTSPSEFTCTDLGVHTLMLTVTDDSGNQSSCTTEVTIIDNLAPEITCTTDQTVDTDAGVCTYTHSGTDWDATATDNCTATVVFELTGVTTGTGTTLAGVTFNPGETNVIWTATDGSNNTDICSFTVTVEDNEAPEISCTTDQTVDADAGVCNYTHSGTAWDATATDNCSVESIAYELTGATTGTGSSLDGVSFNVGVTTVTWTATDGNNNTDVCSFTITVEDNEAPLVTAPGDITVDNDPGECFATNVDLGIPVIQENCEQVLIGWDIENAPVNATSVAPSYTDPLITTALLNEGQRVENIFGSHWYLTRQFGSVSKPVFSMELAKSVYVNTFTFNHRHNHNSGFPTDPEYYAQLQVDAGGTGNYVDIGDPILLNAATAGNQDVIVLNMYLPDGTNNFRFNAVGLNGGTHTGTEYFAVDNVVITYSLEIENDAPEQFPVGDTVVTWTVTDGSGNTATDTQTVTVEDNEAPNAMCVAPFTIQLDANGEATINVGDIDAGSTDNCGIDTMTISQTDFDCSHVGDNTITLTVTDIHGNVSTCTTVVTVEDNVAPDALCVAPFTIQLDANGEASISVGDIDAGSTDACGIDTLTISQTDFDCSHMGDNTITLTVTDIHGNVSTCTTVVTVEDNVAPEALCAAPFTVELDFFGMAYITVDDIDAGSTDACGIASMSIDITEFSCADIGENVVTLTVIDNNGNESTCTTVVTVVDVLAPQIVCPNDIVVNTEPGSCEATVFFGQASAYDNCDGFIPTVQTAGPPTGSTFPIGVTTITFTATDSNGNTSSCDFTITVVDNQAPLAVCQDITIELDANGLATINPEDLDGGSTDNCAGPLSFSASQTVFDCSNLGENTITLTVTDAEGNSSTCTAIVTVEDNIAPVALCVAPFTIELDADGLASITVSDVDAGSTDNCSIATIELSQTTFTCADLGDNEITLTVTDVAGNVTTCTTTVTVEDNIIPVLTCIDFTLELGPDGTALLTPEDIGGTSTDNCEITITAIDIEEFDCLDIGTPVLVTYFASDASGNIASCTAMVTVVDLLGPVIACPADLTVDTDPNSITYTVPDYFAEGLASVTDNCTDPVTITGQVPAPGTLLVDGTYTITLSATDEYGNESTCSFELTVETILGAEDRVDFAGISIYPNPAENNVTIGNPQSIAIDKLSVYDIQGRLVWTKNTHGNTGNQTINVSEFASAVYMVVIESGGKQTVKRLIRK